jgi:hypothetical protein
VIRSRNFRIGGASANAGKLARRGGADEMALQANAAQVARQGDIRREVEPERTAAEICDELIAFLIDHGVRIAPAFGQAIEGETPRSGRCQTAAPSPQAVQDRCTRDHQRPPHQARHGVRLSLQGCVRHRASNARKQES